MHKILFSICFFVFFVSNAQQPVVEMESDTLSTLEEEKVHPLATGYYPIGFFNFDLKTLIKYDNYEGIRLGIGGITNDDLFENVRIGGYLAYGFKDTAFKYKLGGSYLLDKDKKMWANLYFTKDIEEIGTSAFLSDGRVYSLFEPRAINVVQFYKYQTWQFNVESELNPKLLSEFRVSHQNIANIVDYHFLNDGAFFKNYQLAEATLSLRYSPKTEFITNEDGTKEYFDGLPKISAQVTQGFKGIADSDFNYTKLQLKFDYFIKRHDLSSTNIVLEGAYALGDAPLTHLFHAYPNQPNKPTLIKRYSVAGTQSFETMYYGEFFSDKLATLQIKHSLRRFNIAEHLQPELVFITRHAWGNMGNRDQHFGIPFNTLEHLYNESGLELNKIILGFGLSFSYRYGYYHLPNLEDNLSFKFTFNLQLDELRYLSSIIFKPKNK